MECISEAVRDQLLELCEKRGISVNRMCQLSAVPQSTVNNFLNRKTHSLGIITLKKLTDGLNISLADFFSGERFQALEQEIQ